MNKTNIALGMALVAVIIAIGAYAFPKQARDFLGAVGTRFPNGLAVGTTATVTQNKMTIGNSGTAIGTVIHGTCNLTTGSTFVATSTLIHWCDVTGLAAGDRVFVSLPVQIASASSSPLSGPGMFGGISIASASVSSTTDRIAVLLLNTTGAATTSYAGATTSVGYMIIK